MIARMESHWKEWKQPLLILSFALYPSHKLQKFCSSTPNITWTHIGQWLKYYYESWFGFKLVSILRKLVKYKRAEDPYDMNSFNQFHNNLVDFWNSTIGIGPELACVAIRIHGICVNSSVEQLWLTIPINPDDGDEDKGPKLIEEECIQLSDDENEENYENNKNGVEWIELGSLENKFENSEDEAFLLSEWNSDFNLAGWNVHSADDETAKWNLSTLFKPSLESPHF
ncbi:hypothetical protein C1646_773569 [Rhizophagus diaphanus]|nr:hypothetical protein C1646_773569 [Rhizophagus diaphanus] [Rhizophagus sp. MUCL 43196]